VRSISNQEFSADFAYTENVYASPAIYAIALDPVCAIACVVVLVPTSVSFIAVLAPSGATTVLVDATAVEEYNQFAVLKSWLRLIIFWDDLCVVLPSQYVAVEFLVNVTRLSSDFELAKSRSKDGLTGGDITFL
jgi:hypothetical protein